MAKTNQTNGFEIGDLVMLANAAEMSGGSNKDAAKLRNKLGVVMDVENRNRAFLEVKFSCGARRWFWTCRFAKINMNKKDYLFVFG